MTPCDAVLQLHVAFGLQQVPHALVHSAIHRMMERRSTPLRSRSKIPVQGNLGMRKPSCEWEHVPQMESCLKPQGIKQLDTGPIAIVCNHVANQSQLDQNKLLTMDQLLILNHTILVSKTRLLQILSCLVHRVHLHVCLQQHLHRFVVALPGILLMTKWGQKNIEMVALRCFKMPQTEWIMNHNALYFGDSLGVDVVGGIPKKYLRISNWAWRQGDKREITCVSIHIYIYI